MRNRKLALLLTLAMIISMFPINAFATEFFDMPKDWSTKALENAAANGLLKGDNGKIMPNENLTRAQMATIVNRAFGTTVKSSIDDFTDVKQDAWYYDEMSKSVQMKTFIGSGDKLYPDSNITREEAFVVLARAFKISGADENSLDKFSDINDISDWARDGVSSLVAAGYISGSNGRINPKQNITRAEFAQMMDNLIKNYISKDGTYTTDYNGNLMVNTPNVTLKGITVAGDLIIGDGVGDEEVTLDDVTVTGRVLVRGGGENSIKIIGNSKIQNIVIARVDGVVRVYAEDGSEIGEIIADGNDDVIIEGNFGAVTIIGFDITVTARNASLESASIEGENSKIIIDENSSVKTINVNANNVKISGEGTVESVTVNANDVEVTVLGASVTAGEGTSGVTAGELPVLPGDTEIVLAQPVDVGPSGPSRPSGPPPAEDEDVAVIGVRLSPETMTLSTTGTGITGTIKVIVEPDDATNKNVTWTSSDEAVATVANGVVTAKTTGTAIITVTTDDGGHTATCEVNVNEELSVSDDASVLSITINKIAATVDSEDDTVYNVELPYGTVLVDLEATDVVVTATDTNATVGTPETTDNGATWTVEVTAEDGTTTETYTINVTLAAPPASDDASLTSLAVDTGSIEFNAETLTYENVEVSHGTAEVEVTFTAAAGATTDKESPQTVTITDGSGSFSVEVTAEDGETKQTYTINFVEAEAPPVSITKGETTTYYATIQAAIDEAIAKDTIVVAAGTYDEPLTITKDIELQGADGATLTGGTTITGGDVTIKNFTISTKGILASDLTGLTLENNIFSEIESAMEGSPGGSVIGLDVTSASGPIAINNNVFSGIGITDGTGTAVRMVRAADSITITNNIIEGVTKNGINLYSSCLANESAVLTITGNEITNWDSDKDSVGVGGRAIRIDFAGAYESETADISENKLTPPTYGESVEPVDPEYVKLTAVDIKVDLTKNYWGSATPDFGTILKVEGTKANECKYVPYYTDEAMSTLKQE